MVFDLTRRSFSFDQEAPNWPISPPTNRPPLRSRPTSEAKNERYVPRVSQVSSAMAAHRPSTQKPCGHDALSSASPQEAPTSSDSGHRLVTKSQRPTSQEWGSMRTEHSSPGRPSSARQAPRPSGSTRGLPAASRHAVPRGHTSVAEHVPPSSLMRRGSTSASPGDRHVPAMHARPSLHAPSSILQGCAEPRCALHSPELKSQNIPSGHAPGN